jgi:hypothetical protein
MPRALPYSMHTTRQHTIIVHVDDPGGRGERLNHLVDVRLGRDAGADVEELPDARLGRQPRHGAAQERPVRADVADHGRPDLHDGLGCLAVGREIVLAAQPVVVDPGRMRHVRPQVDRAAARRLGSGHVRLYEQIGHQLRRQAVRLVQVPQVCLGQRAATVELG